VKSRGTIKRFADNGKCHNGAARADRVGSVAARDAALYQRHCGPTGRANARPMTGSAKQSNFAAKKKAVLLRRFRFLAQTLRVCRRQ
jgi:hypothetical protein